MNPDFSCSISKIYTSNDKSMLKKITSRALCRLVRSLFLFTTLFFHHMSENVSKRKAFLGLLIRLWKRASHSALFFYIGSVSCVIWIPWCILNMYFSAQCVVPRDCRTLHNARWKIRSMFWLCFVTREIQAEIARKNLMRSLWELSKSHLEISLVVCLYRY